MAADPVGLQAGVEHKCAHLGSGYTSAVTQTNVGQIQSACCAYRADLQVQQAQGYSAS